MTPRDFVYWLQGFLEISGREHIEPRQVAIIKDHLDLVLNKKTPNYNLDNTWGTNLGDLTVKNSSYPNFDKEGFYVIDGKDVPHTC